jgi:hypothetical protein
MRQDRGPRARVEDGDSQRHNDQTNNPAHVDDPGVVPPVELYASITVGRGIRRPTNLGQNRQVSMALSHLSTVCHGQ